MEVCLINTCHVRHVLPNVASAVINLSYGSRIRTSVQKCVSVYLCVTMCVCTLAGSRNAHVAGFLPPVFAYTRHKSLCLFVFCCDVYLEEVLVNLCLQRARVHR